MVNRSCEHAGLCITVSCARNFLLSFRCPLITIADAGLGNFASIANMLNFLEIDAEIRSKPGDVNDITHLILPGVGAFDAGITSLENTGWRKAIEDLSPETKILGICVGMQLFTQGSEEGKKSGLGYVPAICKKFNTELGPVPHIGWNEVLVSSENKILPLSNVPQRFYFTHSFYIEAYDQSLVIGKTMYTNEFVSAFSKDNLYGVQFHPEKSHRFGMEVLKRFANL